MTKHQTWFRRLVLADALLFVIQLSVEFSPLTPSYPEFDFVLEKGLIGGFLSGVNEIHLLILFSIAVSAVIVSWILLYRFHWTGRVLFLAGFAFSFATEPFMGDSVENGLASVLFDLALMLEGAMIFMMFFTELKMQFEQKVVAPLSIERPQP